ncbi:MAG: hypothetical protein IPJ30_15320 [Acidobacteria bacterium]|nr:hypothetical protein [Acidobacteriota bacterium]
MDDLFRLVQRWLQSAKRSWPFARVLGGILRHFYATFIAWKLIAHEPFGPENVALVLANSFIFFGVGYSTLSDQEQYRNYLGLFTLANAAIHFAVAVFIFRFAATAPSVITLIIGLVITFLTIAVPVQLKGHWITLVWIAEAIVLFSIGRIKRIPLYEWFSYPLMLIGTLALFIDWAEASSFSDSMRSNRSIRC